MNSHTCARTIIWWLWFIRRAYVGVAVARCVSIAAFDTLCDTLRDRSSRCRAHRHVGALLFIDPGLYFARAQAIASAAGERIRCHWFTLLRAA